MRLIAHAVIANLLPADSNPRRSCNLNFHKRAFCRTLCRASTLSMQQEDIMVDKDRIQGSMEQAKGKVKEVAGKVTGDAKTESEGKADQIKGKVQNAVGGLKDKAREATE
jgi:uncharacterized protein YjbJ (UPF0337 family)